MKYLVLSVRQKWLLSGMLSEIEPNAQLKKIQSLIKSGGEVRLSQRDARKINEAE
jgi:hypothetical protein